jgi:FkbM family methyltransferase
MSNFQKCFEKHNFEELNNIDINILWNSVNFYLSRYNTTQGVFFDVGTNAGSFVKVLQMFNIRDNIHCFEPHPVLNLKTKEVYPYINMNNYCLGNKDGDIDIYIPTWSVGISSIINRPVFSQLNQEINILNVKCKKIDTYCEENNISNIDFVKIDVEGAEKYVLEGAKNMLENNKIKCGIFEVGQTLVDANTSEAEICDMLEKYGYRIDKTVSRSDYIFYL